MIRFTKFKIPKMKEFSISVFLYKERKVLRFCVWNWFLEAYTHKSQLTKKDVSHE